MLSKNVVIGHKIICGPLTSRTDDNKYYLKNMNTLISLVRISQRQHPPISNQPKWMRQNEFFITNILCGIYN